MPVPDQRPPVAPPLPEGLPEGRLRPIVLYPDPILRGIAEPAGALRLQELEQLAADMLVTMYAAQGRGLAAPQIGVPLRVFVMDGAWKEGTPAPCIVIDPELHPLGDQTGAMVEGCLSIPDHPVSVIRPNRVTLRHLDLAGQVVTRDLDGIEARIAQHEADHLDGRLILDFEAASDAEGEANA